MLGCKYGIKVIVFDILNITPHLGKYISTQHCEKDLNIWQVLTNLTGTFAEFVDFAEFWQHFGTRLETKGFGEI